MDIVIEAGAAVLRMFAEMLLVHLVGFAIAYGAAKGLLKFRTTNTYFAKLFLWSWFMAGSAYTTFWYPGPPTETPGAVLVQLVVSFVWGLLFALFGGGEDPQVLIEEYAKRRKPDSPPISSGDGLSAVTPAVVDCAGITMARRIVHNFVTQHLGEGFTEGLKFTIHAPDDPDRLLSQERFTDKNGQQHDFYFDLSRPVRNEARMMRLEY